VRKSEEFQSEKNNVIHEDTYKNLITHSLDAIAVSNDKGILFANELFLELVEATKNEVIGKNIIFFVHPDYVTLTNNRIQLVRQGDIAEFIEMKIKTLKGKEKEVYVKAIPTTFKNKPARHIIFRDNSYKKKALEMILNSEKLTITGQLAAGIAHEVRNPLTSIRGFIQLLEKSIQNKNDYFDIIYSEVDRIDAILSELLTLSKPHGVHFSTCNVRELLKQVVVLLNIQATLNNISINTYFNAKNLFISCEGNQIKQVFINFIKNSIEAMPNGGDITIEVTKLDNKVKLSFIDQGNGIPDDYLTRVGEPFFTTKENGTGLGLMICKQIIENHKGTFTIKSSKNGTTIDVILPLDHAH
jgi:two-component system sporulation sensor kinase A